MDDEFLRFQNELLSLEVEFQTDQNHENSAAVQIVRTEPDKAENEAKAETKRTNEEVPKQSSPNDGASRQETVCVGKKREAQNQDQVQADDQELLAGKKPRYNDPIGSEPKSYDKPSEIKAVSDVKSWNPSAKSNAPPKSIFKPIKIREGRPSPVSSPSKKSVDSGKHKWNKTSDPQHSMTRGIEHRLGAPNVPNPQESSMYLLNPAPSLTVLPSAHQYPTASGNVQNPNVASVEQKTASVDPTIRTAAGKVWRDPTLTEFPENDFRIFVGNLGQEVTREILDEAFQEYDSFIMSRVVVDKRTSKCKGYGFVSFGHAKDMLAAIKEKNGSYVGSRPCLIRKSKWNERVLDQSKSAELNELKGLARELK